ncbi:hypothetical protein [Ktedonospora formicarum]|uniref:Uncharacterized protein n=1 Tax=Ktedonospora formicarum TaxID=2778364 RepID=A0A8J3I1W6_9CHLR|nr:hypothetical protein [Ktedonospora formicarum]GHO47256.1 hypothetical protein KSX_54190 [Ktedonospora formicarum]
MWNDLHTIRTTYRLILEGERPWTALGDFLNYWYAYAVNQRAALIHDPIEEPHEASLEQHQWAAFCAATVEYLCQRHELPCPLWVTNTTYHLSHPWFTGLGAQRLAVQERLRQQSPEPFARRNIYCNPHAFSTKYEIASQARPSQQISLVG